MFACLNVNGLARMKRRKMNWIGLGRIGKAICNGPKLKVFLQKNALKEKIEWTTGTYSNRLNDKFFENMFVSNLLWPLKFKNNDNGREKKTYIEWEQKILVFFCMKRFGKKTWDASNVSSLCMLTFFVVIFHLQVSEDIWRKVVEKIVDMSGKKLEKCFA